MKTNTSFLSTCPKIVLLGRPNVGKSTLFNRLLGQRRSLVHDKPGVTRDRVEAKVIWEKDGSTSPFPVILVDTGGLGSVLFSEEIKHQVQTAVEQADIILFVVDSQVGLTTADEEIYNTLMRAGLKNKSGQKIPLLLVVNKMDSETHSERSFDFYSLGINPVLDISAEHGLGINTLKETVLNLIYTESQPNAEQNADEGASPSVTRIAIVGRPNVGKSTFINALLKSQRMITSPVAGTTVDVVDSQVYLDGKPYILLDTAGIRRKSKTEQGVEVLSVILAKKALERCDVAVLILDGTEGVTDQDEKIGALIEEAGCSVILAVNKWDTQKNKKGFNQDDAAELVRNKMAYLRYAPLLFMSAIEKTGFEDLSPLIDDILADRNQKLQTRELTEFLREACLVHNPKNAKIYLCHQASKFPPTFVCHVNDPEKLPFNLRGHLYNAIRERWGFRGTPLKLLFRRGSGHH